MEILIKRYNSLTQALKTLYEVVLMINDSSAVSHEIIRDSVIQRFEYSADLFWKVLKEYFVFIQKINVEIASPKGIFQMCFDCKLFNESDFKSSRSLIEDRNLTSHSYNEDLAEEISTRILDHYAFMAAITKRIGSDIQKSC